MDTYYIHLHCVSDRPAGVLQALDGHCQKCARTHLFPFFAPQNSWCMSSHNESILPTQRKRNKQHINIFHFHSEYNHSWMFCAKYIVIYYYRLLYILITLNSKRLLSFSFLPFFRFIVIRGTTKPILGCHCLTLSDQIKLHKNKIFLWYNLYL